MGAILHLPQGGAQITVVSEIPEVPIDGQDTSIEDILVTYGSYTQVVANDGSYQTVAALWDTFESWEKASQNGDMVIINATKHNGLNFQPQSVVHPCTVSFMYIDRVMDFSSKRLIARVQISEASWASTLINIHLVPVDTNRDVAADIEKVREYLNGNADKDILTLSYRHSGLGSADSDIGLMVGELASAGKYKIAISMEPSVGNACPSIYSLNFRTY